MRERVRERGRERESERVRERDSERVRESERDSVLYGPCEFWFNLCRVFVGLLYNRSEFEASLLLLYVYMCTQ